MMKPDINVLFKIMPLVSIVLLVGLLTAINPNFLGAYNIRNLLGDIGPLLVLGCGITFVLLIGSIDLSVGAVISCSAVLFAIALPKVDVWAYPLILLFGAVAGLLNGVLFTRLKISSFIVTLGTMGLWQSVAYILSKGGSVPISRPQWDLIAWGKIRFGVVPLMFLIPIGIFLVAVVLQRYTKFGKSCFAVGANERAAWMAGLKIDRTKILAMGLCGLLAALMGLLLAVKIKSGSPNTGLPFTLLGITAVVLGGTALTGGKGSIISTFLGVTLVTVIQNGMNVIGVESFWQQLVFGVLVILAVYMTTDKSSRGLIVK